MKLGIFMLIIGLIIAAAGAGLFVATSDVGPFAVRENAPFGAVGLVLGGGLAIGRLVRMIVKR